MADFLIPTQGTVDEIAQDLLPRLIANRPIFDEFPIRNKDTTFVFWEQRDNFQGLQYARGLNGEPPFILAVGSKRYMAQPGVYGEAIKIDERDLTERRQLGTFGQPVDVSDLVIPAERQLLVRRLDRQEWLVWQLLVNGTFNTLGPSGAVLHQDTYTTQTFTSAVPWSTAASATPLADFRAIILKHRGHSVSFGAGARAYMNRVTLNQLLINGNQTDLGGRRVSGLAQINSLEQMNALNTMDGLPTIVEYDAAYISDGRDGTSAGTAVPFLPDGYVIVIGKRADNAPVGEVQMLRNANNPGLAPGAYTRVIDRANDHIPRSIEVHDGFNGGIALHFPSAIIAMNVS